jgi:hypothetical protein
LALHSYGREWPSATAGFLKNSDGAGSFSPHRRQLEPRSVPLSLPVCSGACGASDRPRGSSWPTTTHSPLPFGSVRPWPLSHSPDRSGVFTQHERKPSFADPVPCDRKRRLQRFRADVARGAVHPDRYLECAFGYGLVAAVVVLVFGGRLTRYLGRSRPVAANGGQREADARPCLEVSEVRSPVRTPAPGTLVPSRLTRDSFRARATRRGSGFPRNCPIPPYVWAA